MTRPPSIQGSFKGWLKALDRLLTSGYSESDGSRLSLLLSSAPQGWHLARSLDTGWGPLPCWTRVLANKTAERPWISRALELCGKHGAMLSGHYPKSPSGKLAVEPIYLGLTERLAELNASAYMDYLLRHTPLSPSHPRQRANALIWLSRVFAHDELWAQEQVSARVLTWGVLEAIPSLKTSPLGAQVWVSGLGFSTSGVLAPRALRVLAMGGLDGNIVIGKDDIPPASLASWPSETLGEWRPAPAWAWASLQGVFKGNRMLLREVLAHQSTPWDPNGSLSQSTQSVGQWLLDTSVRGRRSPASSLVMELDVLGFDWMAGELGSRAFDLLVERGGAHKALGTQRWEQLQSEAGGDRLSRSLPSPPVRSGPRARL